MKTICLLLALTMALSKHAFAQVGIVQHQLDRIQNANNANQAAIARQTDPAAARPGSPQPGNPAALPTPGLQPPANPEQLKLIDQFSTNLASFKQGVAATPTQLSNLVTGITSLSKIGTKPGKDMLNKLASSMADVLKEKTLPAKDLHSLAAYVSGVMNSSSFPAGTAGAIVQHAQSMLTTDGVSQPTATTFSQNLAGIASYIQKNKPDLFK